jgi:hypothetical protein
MAMPEAAVNHDGCTEAGEHDVGRSREVADVQPVSKAVRVKRLAQARLGAGIPSPDPAHHSRSGGFVDDVYHPEPWKPSTILV